MACVLIPLVPVLIGLTVSSGDAASGAGTSSLYKPLISAAPPASAPSQSAAALPAGSGALVAVVRHPTAILSSPGGTRLAPLGVRTPFGSAQVMWVRVPGTHWLGVVSPVAGNGKLGWVSRGAVSLSRVNWRLEVSLGARRLTVFEHGRAVEHYTVAIGSPAAPTPTGQFAVTDLLSTGDPAGPYGCCIVALSAEAPHAIQGWTGGNRIAIHSTPETSSIGLPVSHGCLRLTLAEGRWLMRHIPLGTPTIISA